MGTFSAQQYTKIIGKQEYSYLCEQQNINNICRAFRSLFFEKEATTQARILTEYLTSAIAVQRWIGESNRFVKEGITKIVDTVRSGLFLATLQEAERTAVSRHRANRLETDLLEGLSLLGRGVAELFDQEIIPEAVSKEELVRFILDKEVGIARQISLNNGGVNSFTKQLLSLTRKQIERVIKELREWRVYEKSKARGWKVLGSKRDDDAVRIHCTNNFGMKKVYRVYAVNGQHDQHERDLATSIASAQFVPL